MDRGPEPESLTVEKLFELREEIREKLSARYPVVSAFIPNRLMDAIARWAHESVERQKTEAAAAIAPIRRLLERDKESLGTLTQAISQMAVRHSGFVKTGSANVSGGEDVEPNTHLVPSFGQGDTPLGPKDRGNR